MKGVVQTQKMWGGKKNVPAQKTKKRGEEKATRAEKGEAGANMRYAKDRK